MLLPVNIGSGWLGQERGFKRRVILALRLRRILGYFRLTRNVLLG